MNEKLTTVRKICITGGTCAGKTTVFEKLKERLDKKTHPEYKDLTVIYIPESATEMMSYGMCPFLDNLGPYEFQKMNLKNQLFREELALDAAYAMKDKNVLIVTDRSSLEQQVFVSKEDWNKILSNAHLTNEMLENSYDAVFHLVSTALGAEYAYGMISNEHRIHTLEEAREQELLAQKIWTPSKKLHIYDNTTDFSTKVNNCLHGIATFIYEEYGL